MRLLHFYIQSALVLLGLSIAVQVPIRQELFVYVVLLELFLVVYQTGMSVMLFTKLTKTSKLQHIHFFGSLAYLFLLIGLGVLDPQWMNQWWDIAFFVCPWVFIILFLVTIDDLERVRHYR